MSPRKGRSTSQWPIIVASKQRALFDYRDLDAGLRLRIRARRHAHGLSLAPIDKGDAEACAWIVAQAERRGIVKWKNPPHRPGASGGWVKEKYRKGTDTVVK